MSNRFSCLIDFDRFVQKISTDFKKAFVKQFNLILNLVQFKLN